MSVYKLKGTSGGLINQSFPIKERLVVGSAEDCDVRIEEPDVAGRHAEIRLLGDKTLQLTDLGSKAGTLLNGEPVSEILLGSGDEIRIGTCRLMLQAPGLRPERVLTADAVRQPKRYWPRVVAWSIVAATAAALAVITWKPEWVAGWLG
jgi:pSer/pThr/pTyr-binding forkhead associated (FHA) protein